MSPTVLRQGPFRVYFFSLEESRMHVHVETVDGVAKFWLEPSVQLATTHRMNRQMADRAHRLVSDHEEEIRRAWHKHFSG